MRRALTIAFMALVLAACTKSNMDDQPKDNEYKAGTLREPPPGSVARDDLAREQATTQKPKVDAALLSRGRERSSRRCS